MSLFGLEEVPTSNELAAGLVVMCTPTFVCICMLCCWHKIPMCFMAFLPGKCMHDRLSSECQEVPLEWGTFDFMLL